MCNCDKIDYKKVVKQFVRDNSDMFKLFVKASGHDGNEQFYTIHIHVDGYEVFVSKPYSDVKDYTNIAYKNILYYMISAGMDTHLENHKEVLKNRLLSIKIGR